MSRWLSHLLVVMLMLFGLLGLTLVTLAQEATPQVTEPVQVVVSEPVQVPTIVVQDNGLKDQIIPAVVVIGVFLILAQGITLLKQFLPLLAKYVDPDTLNSFGRQLLENAANAGYASAKQTPTQADDMAWKLGLGAAGYQIVDKPDGTFVLIPPNLATPSSPIPPMPPAG